MRPNFGGRGFPICRMSWELPGRSWVYTRTCWSSQVVRIFRSQFGRQQKVWTDEIWTLELSEPNAKWASSGRLPRALAYGAAASTDSGIVCIGGNDQHQLYDEVFLLKWDDGSAKLVCTPLPSLPAPFAFGQATAIDNVVYVACGQTDMQLSSATNNLWSLDVGATEPERLAWKKLPQLPGQSRAFSITACQKNGETNCVYVLGGRFQSGTETRFLKDAWEFNPEKNAWRQLSNMPYNVTAGTGIGFGKNELFVLGGDDGSLFTRTEELKDKHPGFRKESLRYDTVTDHWTIAGATPMNQVTTIPVKWNEQVIVASGEVRPRVRTPAVWLVERAAARACGES